MMSTLCIAFLLVAGLGVASGAEEGTGDNPLRAFFPYGVYLGGNSPEYLPDLGKEELRASIDRVCADLAAHGMNCAWPNNLRWENLPLWLEAGQKHGIRIVPQGGGPPGFVRAAWFADREDFARRVEPFYRDMAVRYRDDPALLAWSLTEENEPVPWFYEAIAELTGKMAEWDPDHPMITMDNKDATAWLNAQIVKPKGLTRDVYVFFADGLNGPYEPMGFRSLLTRTCQRFREAADSVGGVYWLMGQGMRLVGHGDGREQLSWRYPTPEEIRWQVWTSIQEGAKGFFYFFYRGASSPPQRGEFIEGLRGRYGEETEQFRMAGEVGRQIRPLMPLLLQLDVAPPHQSIVYWENTPVSGQTFTHRQTGRRFLIAVNHDCAAIQRVGIELGYFPQFLEPDDKLFDLRSGRGYDYQSIKLTTLLPGDGTIYFVGSESDWKAFSSSLYEQP
ncbi:MAG: hypothetical protein HOC74_18000 [Gemmatimonadetes bacterium]|jgi:hypothetical protein|nr:hypothetical protein [Gemmatimonadota bacterium]